MRSHFIVHEDPGHGWVAVKRDEINELGIGPAITPYSYQSWDGEACFLEEDCDFATLYVALKKRGIEMTWDHVHTDNEHWIRGLRSFSHRKAVAS